MPSEMLLTAGPVRTREQASQLLNFLQDGADVSRGISIILAGDGPEYETVPYRGRASTRMLEDAIAGLVASRPWCLYLQIEVETRPGTRRLSRAMPVNQSSRCACPVAGPEPFWLRGNYENRALIVGRFICRHEARIYWAGEEGSIIERVLIA